MSEIRKIVRLKHVVKRWLRSSRRPSVALSGAGSSKGGGVTPRGSLAVYVGAEGRRFVIPTRYVNLPVFRSLLSQAEEEFGYENNGGLALPCEVGLFERVVELLEGDEDRYGAFGLDEFLCLFSGMGLDYSCSQTAGDRAHWFTPLLQKTQT